jgi:hypothetical protein
LTGHAFRLSQDLFGAKPWQRMRRGRDRVASPLSPPLTQAIDF